MSNRQRNIYGHSGVIKNLKKKKLRSSDKVTLTSKINTGAQQRPKITTD